MRFKVGDKAIFAADEFQTGIPSHYVGNIVTISDASVSSGYFAYFKTTYGRDTWWFREEWLTPLTPLLKELV